MLQELNICIGGLDTGILYVGEMKMVGAGGGYSSKQYYLSPIRPRAGARQVL